MAEVVRTVSLDLPPPIMGSSEIIPSDPICLAPESRMAGRSVDRPEAADAQGDGVVLTEAELYDM